MPAEASHRWAVPAWTYAPLRFREDPAYQLRLELGTAKLVLDVPAAGLSAPTLTGAGSPTSDLRLVRWTNSDDLRARLLEQLADALSMSGPDDLAGFDRALRLTKEKSVPFEDHSGAERFQVLSPVRMRPWGTYELNRDLQRHFRKVDVTRGRRTKATYGPEEIVIRDKVILVRNRKRRVQDVKTSAYRDEYLANGEVGLVATVKGGFFNVAFAGHAGTHAGFRKVSGRAEAVDLEPPRRWSPWSIGRWQGRGPR